MYSVEANGSKRLVVISAAGLVTAEEVKAAAQELRELVKDAAPGFRVLTDFRWLESASRVPHQLQSYFLSILRRNRADRCSAGSRNRGPS